MTRIKYIGLLIGLFLVILSCMFFGRQHAIYNLLLIIGLFISFVFYLIILLKKGKIKTKLLWTFIVIFAAILQWITEPILIKYSYRIYLYNNNIELTTVNNILRNKAGKITILNSEITEGRNHFTETETIKLINLRKKLNVYFISKNENEIYYGFWGFLDVRLGVTYLINNSNPDKKLSNLKDNWYIDNK